MTMMRDNTHRMTARNRKRTLRDAIYRVLQDAGGSLQVKEILGRIRAKKLYVFTWRDGSVCSDLLRMRIRVGTACTQSPRFVRTARATYAIAKEYLNRSNTQDAVRPSSLRDAIYRVLQDAGGRGLHTKEILGRIRAKKLYVFRRRDGSVSTDDEKMRDCVRSACWKSPCFVRTEPGTYAIATESLNGSNTQVAARPSPLRDAIYRVLQDAGGRGLHTKEILGRIRAKKLYVFRRRDGSVSTDDEKMRDCVRSACWKSPCFVCTEPGTYALPLSP